MTSVSTYKPLIKDTWLQIGGYILTYIPQNFCAGIFGNTFYDACLYNAL